MKEFSMDLKIYRALLYDNCNAGDDRLQVRIMPYMAEIKGEDEENLPKYPPFFKGTTIRGWAEKDPERKAPISSLFVLANYDFTVGYVLGLMNEFNGFSEKLKSSWNFKNTKSCIQRTGALPVGFNYENLVVKQNLAGNLIEIEGYKSPFKIIMTCYGDIFTIQNNRIFMMSRSGPGSGEESSYIDIRPDRIECKAKVFDLSQSDKVILGHTGMNALGTVSTMPAACDGMNLTPNKHIII